MEKYILHERESSEETESFLKDNGKKFNKDCIFILKLLYKGMRLHARQVEVEFNKDGRRLRDIIANKKECKKQWVLNEKGKRLYVEYWLEPPKPLTKRGVREWCENYKEKNPQSDFFQPELF